MKDGRLISCQEEMRRFLCFVQLFDGEGRSAFLNTMRENICFGLTKQVFSLDEFLFSLGGTFIFTWWNFYFLPVELLFSLCGTSVFTG